MPLFSIIIPTYNVESYIARCLDSCINQTLGDIEILVINDCGSDDSISIAKTYASKDSRIRIIHNPTNLGLFATRITGEKEAQGTYILHLDADDYLTLNACERAYQKASMALNSTPLSSNTQTHSEQEEKNLPDIIHFRPAYRGSSQASLSANCLHKLRYILPTRFSHKPLQNEQIAYNFFLKSTQFPKFTLWDKCYKTSLIRQILPFMECFIPLKLTMAEDMLKFFAISALAKSYVSLDERLYIYCLNHSSITQNIKAKDKKIADMCYISEALPSLATQLEQNTKSTKSPSLMPQIAKRLCHNLTALIILESRFDTSYTTADSTNSLDSALTTLNQTLAPLLESHLIAPVRIPRFIPSSILKHSPYLRACILSLQYWNRCLTYVRICAYLLSFGRVKL